MIEPWKKLKQEPAFNTRFRKIDKITFQLPDNKVEDFFIKKEGPAACVLALTDEKNVVLAKQFRPGLEQILLEMPGGKVEENENPEDAIKREFLEETGYVGDFQFVGKSFDDAYSTMVRFNFVATSCKKIREPQPENTEFIQVVEMPLSEFRDHLRKGELSDIECGYLGLDFLNLL